MLTVLLMADSGSLMAGTSLLVSSSTTKIRTNGDQARSFWAAVSESASSACATSRRCSAGTLASLRDSAKAKVSTSEKTAATTSASAGPMNMAASSSGTAKLRPATRVTGSAPLRALGPPPTSMTMRIGQATTNGNTWTAWVVASCTGSMPVMEASVVVGMPIEPNMVGTPLAIRQHRMAVTGEMPSATSIDAGMATAVPKPAMPSRKPPKHQPMSSVRTRLSAETPHSMRLIESIAPVWTVRL